MDLAHLEVFLAVAREGRFSRAAEKLHRTQSAVSQTIHKLEQELGEPLFDRFSREGILTDAGRVLQEYAERLINLRCDAQEALAELRHLHQGKLAIAANELTALYLLPVLAEFRRLHPMVRLLVQRSLGSQIPDDVLRHNSEIGVLTYNPQEPPASLHCRISRRTYLRRTAATSLGPGTASEYPAARHRVLCGAHRVVALSGKSHSGF
jgi:DNA-binding transcriptional LysR family regulator